MADRALTPDQVAVLASLQKARHGLGKLTAYMVAGRRATWCRSRLESLRRRGLVIRDQQNDERWYATPAGLAVDLSTSEPIHG